ncbi:hypothetical protein CEXT_82371 [Caerostris extrusa]|uniref:Uncharacterized protein n=1 Tax=Caerostris extrusa TaxID=172846 RepID=A0AAV4QIQ4_CAEEX|nr:hypothetical protein CEXT_82371 [Caerostris extrusa]
MVFQIAKQCTESTTLTCREIVGILRFLDRCGIFIQISLTEKEIVEFVCESFTNVSYGKGNSGIRDLSLCPWQIRLLQCHQTPTTDGDVIDTLTGGCGLARRESDNPLRMVCRRIRYHLRPGGRARGTESVL